MQYDCFEVDLRNRYPIGPGFSVTGTVTDGITVRSLHDKGAAIQSGQVLVGRSLVIFITDNT